MAYAGPTTRPPRSERYISWLLWLVLAYLAVDHLLLEPMRSVPADFYIYHTYAGRAWEGINPYIDMTPGDGTAGYVYPVGFLSVLLPLSQLAAETAGRVFRGINIVIALICTLMAMRWIARVPVRNATLARMKIAVPLMGILVVGGSPVAETLRIGQSNVVVAGAVCAMLGFLMHGRPVWAGIFYAVAIIYKVLPILWLPGLLPLLGWAGFFSVAACGTAYLLFLGATGLWRWEWYLFSERLPEWNTKIEATTISIFHELAWRTDLGVAAANSIARACEMLLVVVGCVGALWLWRNGRDKLLPFAWIVAWVMPSVRFLEYHHLVFLVPAQAVLVAVGLRSGKQAPLFFGVASAALVQLAYTLRNLWPGDSWIVMCYAGMLAAIIGVVVTVRQSLKTPQA